MYFGKDTETCWLPLPGVRAGGVRYPTMHLDTCDIMRSILGSFIHCMLAVSLFGKDDQNIWYVLSGICARGREIFQIGANVYHVGTRI